MEGYPYFIFQLFGNHYFAILPNLLPLSNKLELFHLPYDIAGHPRSILFHRFFLQAKDTALHSEAGFLPC